MVCHYVHAKLEENNGQLLLTDERYPSLCMTTSVFVVVVAWQWMGAKE